MNCLKKRLSFFGVATVALVFAGVAEAEQITLHVDVDEASFVGPAPGIQGPFNVKGDTGSGPGTFQCWGWIYEDGTANVSQTYIISGRGMIMTQGIEGGLLAVVGGTDDFRHVTGDGDQVFIDLTVDFNFTIAFDLNVDDDDSDSDSDD